MAEEFVEASQTDGCNLNTKTSVHTLSDRHKTHTDTNMHASSVATHFLLVLDLYISLSVTPRTKSVVLNGVLNLSLQLLDSNESLVKIKM